MLSSFFHEFPLFTVLKGVLIEACPVMISMTMEILNTHLDISNK